MNQQHHDYQVASYPKMRRLEALAYRSVQHKPMIHGLIEVDVSRARAHPREQKAKTGEALSFTAFLIACLAKAVDEHKAVQAYRKGANMVRGSRWHPRMGASCCDGRVMGKLPFETAM